MAGIAVAPNLADRIIGWFAPRAGAARIAWRTRLAAMAEGGTPMPSRAPAPAGATAELRPRRTSMVHRGGHGAVRRVPLTRRT